MKTSDLSTIHRQLRLLALHAIVQTQTPSLPSLRFDLEALHATLQALYPEVDAEATSLSLSLQRFLFAGALRAKEFLQLQQALRCLSQSPDDEALAAHARQVREILASFVPREFVEAWSEHPAAALEVLAARDEAEGERALGALGVEGAAALWPQLSVLPREEGSARWLAALSESPTPERSLRWLVALWEAPFGRSYYRAFSGHAAWRSALLRLSGLSEPLSRRLLRCLELPEELSLHTSWGRMPSAPSIEALHLWRQQEELRVLLAWCAAALTLYEAQRALSLLAEAVVARCLQAALAEDHAQHSAAVPRLAVVALGSLGAYELLYQSDLDLLFLSDGDPAHEERCTRIAQRAIELLSARRDEGLLYEVDTRLRPSGTQGPLVASLQGWSRYFGLIEGEGPRGHLWEEQALLRARPLTGDEALLAEFSALHRRVLARPREADLVASELRQMRQRIEAEVPKHRRFYYKASAGGLYDIDFVVHFLQLTHANRGSTLLCPTTQKSLTMLSGAGLLSSDDAALLLSAHASWVTLTLLTRLLVEKSLDFLPERSDALRRALGAGEISSEEAFQKQLELLRAQVRACFDRVIR